MAASADLPPPQPNEITTNGLPVEDTTTTMAPGLSADEIALYDRQIRLWGAKAQESIRSASILLISLRALGNEIAKNLTLAGISSLTIVDDEPVTEDDLGAQYFLREEDVGKPRAEAAIPRIQELNPRVNVNSGGSLSDLLAKDQTYYAPFSCVIACDHDFDTISLINTTARFADCPFYTSGIHGFYGYIFADLVARDFVIERAQSNITTKTGIETPTRSVLKVTNKKEPNGTSTEIVQKQEVYCPLILANSSPLSPDILSNRRKLKSVPPLLPALRALFEFQRSFKRLPDVHQSQDDLKAFMTLATTKSAELQLPQGPEGTLTQEFLKKFLQCIGSEIVPTAAFIGGRLSEDVINVLGKREQPIQNFAFFDGDNLDGRIYCLHTPMPQLPVGGLPQMNGMAQMNGNGNMGMMQPDLGMADGSMGTGMLSMGVADDGFANGVAGMTDGSMGMGMQSMPATGTNGAVDMQQNPEVQDLT